MNATAWVGLIVNASIMLTVLSIGLRATPREALFVLRRPALLLRSLGCMYVIMPAFAIGISLLFDLHQAVKIALVALSLSPVPPFLPKQAARAGGSQEYVLGLLVASTALSVILIPVLLGLVSDIASRNLAMPAGDIFQIVVASVLAPMALGILVRYLSPAIASRAALGVGRVGAVLLFAALAVLLIGTYREMLALLGNGTLASLAAFCLVGLLAGHLLQGGRQENRVVLAICTASRHPGMALALAQANFPAQNQAPAAIVLYLVVSVTITTLYSVWAGHAPGRKPALPAAAEGGPQGLRPA